MHHTEWPSEGHSAPSALARPRFTPSLAYRFFRKLGVIGAGELLCQSKPRFFSLSICAVALCGLLGAFVGGSDLAIFTGAIAAFLICIALVISISVELPKPGLPLTMTPDFLHRSAQCQLHIPNRGVGAKECVLAITDSLDYVDSLGLRGVLLSSVLIGSDSMRQRLVKRLNVELARRGEHWIALDEGTEISRSGYLAFHLKYRLLPWLTTSGAYQGADLARDRNGAHLWGMVYLQHTG